MPLFRSQFTWCRDATFSYCGGFYFDVNYMIQIQSLTLSMDLSGIFSLLHNYLIHLSLVCWWWTLSSKFATFQLHRPLQAVANNCAEFTIRTVQSPSDRLWPRHADRRASVCNLCVSQFNLMYLVGVVLVCAGNLLFYWRPVLGLEDLSSLVGSSGSSGDTEVSSDTASCAGSGIRWEIKQIIKIFFLRIFRENNYCPGSPGRCRGRAWTWRRRCRARLPTTCRWAW